MPHFPHWLRAALCCCTVATVVELSSAGAEQPGPSNRPAPSAAETIPPPVLPLEESVAASGPKPPPQQPLSALSIDIRPVGEAPANAAAVDHYLGAPEFDPTTRDWNETLYFWQASNMVHQPLYFQQAYVERYGYNYGCLQPIVSGVQFAGDVATLPIQCAVRPPRSCVWTLGYGRPGSQGVPCPRY